MVALLSRISAGAQDDNDPALKDLRVTFEHFKNRRPDFLSGMGAFTRAERRAAARRVGWRPESGEL